MNSNQATIFGKAIGDPTRHEILRFCCCEKRSVGDIATHAGIRQPTATHHLAVLTEAGLVKREQLGKQVYYSVDQKSVVSCCGRLMLNLAPDEEATQAVKKCC